MTGKKDHPQADELQALLDGEWSGREAQEMAGHLEGCDRCRDDLRSLELLFGELDTLEQSAAPEPGPQFSRRVMAEIVHRETAERVRRNHVIVPAAAAAILALVLALWLAPSPSLSAEAGNGGTIALPVLISAMLKIIHSGAVMASEGLDLAFRLARTASGLLAVLPGSVWFTCLALFCTVHGALALCLKQYGRRSFGSIRT